MKWALNVHAFYYRGNYERATRKEIRETFENDIYNLESSVRSALAIRYKLKAAGIPASCVNPGEEFYRRVLAPEADAAPLWGLFAAAASAAAVEDASVCGSCCAAF